MLLHKATHLQLEILKDLNLDSALKKKKNTENTDWRKNIMFFKVLFFNHHSSIQVIFIKLYFILFTNVIFEFRFSLKNWKYSFRKNC